MSIFDFLRRKSATNSGKSARKDCGILVFDNTSEVIRAERTLKENGWKIQVKGPPPEIRTGCDLVIEFPLIEELNIIRILRNAQIFPRDVVPVSSPLLQPVDLFHEKDYGQFLMIRAANMKLTIDKKTLMIVNVSGGGCPDVPYLAAELVGKTLGDAQNPNEIGHTLCGYALCLAYEEMVRRCSR